MEKGKLIISKSKKGRIIVNLDRLNGKNPMILSYVSNLTDADKEKYNGSDCEFKMVKGKITIIKVGDATIYSEVKKTQNRHQQENKGRHGNQNRNQNNNRNNRNNRNNIKYLDSLKIEDTYLPMESLAPLLNDIHNNGIDNFALKLNRAARSETSYKGDIKFKFYHKDRRNQGNYKIKEDYGNTDFVAICERQYKSAESLLGSNKVETFDLDVDWRLLQGLGIANVYETSMTLHHIYGFPYIPSSAIKGVTRNWIINNIFSNYESDGKTKRTFDLEKAEDRAMANPDFIQFFGSQDSAGKTIFFDAMPLNHPKIEVDIMNPHYGQYYNSTKAPVDFDNPNPIPFLSVAKGTRFKFIVGTKDDELKPLLGKSIKEWLQSALTDHGIGAKTAVGYGYFSETK